MGKQDVFVEDVVKDTLAALEKQGYAMKGRRFQTIFRGLSQFSHNNFGGKYSFEVGEAYIQSLKERNVSLSTGYLRENILEIQRVNRVMEGDLGWRPSKPSLEYEASSFQNEARAYEEYLRNSGKTKSDLRSRMHIVARFLHFIDVAGTGTLSDITATNIYNAFEQAADKCNFHKCVSAFLRYAYRHSLTNQDLSVLVPFATRHTPVPTVYSPEEVKKIIMAASQSKTNGKRNKVIVLIAAGLGLRSCDIANLRFENIRRECNTIELTQLKTHESMRLPLLPEILVALDDYLENERPKSNDEHIFLNNLLPYTGAIQPHTIYTIVSRIIDGSGVDPDGRKRGAHALRSSLATALINEGYNHREVQNALGQKSPEAVKSYVKTEVEHLRDYALSVPAPIGAFASALGLEDAKW